MSSNVITEVTKFEKPTVPEATTAPIVEQSAPAAAPVVPPSEPTPVAAEPQAPEATAAESTIDNTAVITETISAANEELATTGKLTEDSLKKLAEVTSLPQEFIEVAYEGMLHRQQKNNAEILGVAGGTEAYTEMVTWATSVYSAEEAAAFNSALKGGNLQSAKEAVAALRKKFTEVNGSPKALIAKATQVPAGSVPSPSTPGTAQTNVNPAVKPFASFAEVTEAMKDKRYGKDNAYTAEVYRRVQISNY